jgi:hypothetical protein
MEQRIDRLNPQLKSAKDASVHSTGAADQNISAACPSKVQNESGNRTNLPWDEFILTVAVQFAL